MFDSGSGAEQEFVQLVRGTFIPKISRYLKQPRKKQAYSRNTIVNDYLKLIYEHLPHYLNTLSDEYITLNVQEHVYLWEKKLTNTKTLTRNDILQTPSWLYGDLGLSGKLIESFLLLLKYKNLDAT